MVPTFLSSLGSSHFSFRYQSLRFHLTWSQNRAQMELNWIRTRTKMRKTQIIPSKPCTGTLVSSSEIQNRGTRTGTAEPQELRLQYQNRDWTENSVPSQHYPKHVIEVLKQESLLEYEWVYIQMCLSGQYVQNEAVVYSRKSQTDKL